MLDESTEREMAVTDVNALAVDSSQATLGDSVVGLTLGQEDDILPDGQAGPRQPPRSLGDDRALQTIVILVPIAIGSP